MPVAAAEYTRARTYLTGRSLPWQSGPTRSSILPKTSRSWTPILRSQRAKDRILEYLAVRKLNPNVRGDPLFVGLPAWARRLSRDRLRIARRSFRRVSLGGMRDERKSAAHRRTYIGALPGQVIQAAPRGIEISGCSSSIGDDKLRLRFPRRSLVGAARVLEVPSRTTPSATIHLERAVRSDEVLFHHDRQRARFPFPALRDRMEVARDRRLHGGRELQIATDHLVDKQVEEPRLTAEYIRFTPIPASGDRGYTREAGVRNLEREIGSALPEGGAPRHSRQRLSVDSRLTSFVGARRTNLVRQSEPISRSRLRTPASRV